MATRYIIFKYQYNNYYNGNIYIDRELIILYEIIWRFQMNNKKRALKFVDIIMNLDDHDFKLDRARIMEKHNFPPGLFNIFRDFFLENKTKFEIKTKVDFVKREDKEAFYAAKKLQLDEHYVEHYKAKCKNILHS